MNRSDFDYLLGQSLQVSNEEKGKDGEAIDEYQVINEMKIKLCQSAILSRMLNDESITINKVLEVSKQLIEVQNALGGLFHPLNAFEEHAPGSDASVNGDDTDGTSVESGTSRRTEMG